MKNKKFQILVDQNLFEKVKDLSRDGGISEFIRQAIDEKISSLNAKRSEKNNQINDNSSDNKKLEMMLYESSIENKVLLQQMQSQQEILKLILRRATSGALHSNKVIDLVAPTYDKSELKISLDQAFSDDLIRLKM